MNALQRISRARSSLIMNQPFFGCLALNLQLMEDETCGTMATDGRHLFYAPDFVTRLSDPELRGVLMHEVLHCAHGHMLRRRGRDPKKWNVACDYAINLEVIDAGGVLPKGGLVDEQYRDMHAEAIYAKLPKDIVAQLGGGGEGDDIGGCGGVLDAVTDGNKAKEQEVANDWHIKVKQAIGVEKARNKNSGKKKTPGNLPGHIQRLAGELETPEISVAEQLKQFIDDRRAFTDRGEWEYEIELMMRRGQQFRAITATPARVSTKIIIEGEQEANNFNDGIDEMIAQRREELEAGEEEPFDLYGGPDRPYAAETTGEDDPDRPPF